MTHIEITYSWRVDDPDALREAWLELPASERSTDPDNADPAAMADDLLTAATDDYGAWGLDEWSTERRDTYAT